jgi:hypothetical protein
MHRMSVSIRHLHKPDREKKQTGQACGRQSQDDQRVRWIDVPDHDHSFRKRKPESQPSSRTALSVEIDLTEKGTRLLKNSRERAHVLERELARGLSSQEEKTVRRWLVQVAAGGGLS